MHFRFLAKASVLALTGASLAGCSTIEGFLPTTVASPPSTMDQHGKPILGSEPARNEQEKIVVLPLSSTDFNCPSVEIREGGAAFRAGGPSNESVRYQFQIDEFARECDPAGPNRVALKIGVQGKLLIGPAGSPGAYSADLNVSIRHETDQKIAFSKTYRVSATSGPGGDGPFQIVTEPVDLPVASADVSSEYSIFIGFGGGGEKPGKRKR